MTNESQWIDAPTGDGWYWLEQFGEHGPPVYVIAGVIGGASWVFSIGTTWFPVRGRVCKIGERPNVSAESQKVTNLRDVAIDITPSVAERIVTGLEQFADELKRGDT